MGHLNSFWGYLHRLTARYYLLGGISLRISRVYTHMARIHISDHQHLVPQPTDKTLKHMNKSKVTYQDKESMHLSYTETQSIYIQPQT
jgi:hypothetical protein